MAAKALYWAGIAAANELLMSMQTYARGAVGKGSISYNLHKTVMLGPSFD
jgi:hypothetical protein